MSRRSRKEDLNRDYSRTRFVSPNHPSYGVGDEDNPSYGPEYPGQTSVKNGGETSGGSTFMQKVRRFFQDDNRGKFYGKVPQGYVRSDERIREDLCDRIMNWGELDPRELEVHVERGEVTLGGLVENRSEKYAVEELADSILGVKEVHNHLRVKNRE